VFAAMATLSGTGGLVLGAAALQLSQAFAPEAGLKPWQLVLVIVGVPPLLLGWLFALTASEPARGLFDAQGEASAAQASFSILLKALRKHAGFYLSFYLGNALILVTVFGTTTWMPALLVRGHGWAPATAGYAIGAIGLATGLVGSVFWPRLVVILTRRGVRHPLPLALSLACACSAPFMIVGPSLPDATYVLLCMAASLLCTTSLLLLPPLAMQHYGPPRLRAKLIALTTLSGALIGYGVAPAAIGLLAAQWPGDPRSLGYALSFCALATSVPAAIAFYIARRGARSFD
jgi:hypothetical protein